MAPINVDETIQKLLYNYVKWAETVHKQEVKKVQNQKFFDRQDETRAAQRCSEQKNAIKFLKEIAKNPKKYLYSGKDIKNTYLEDKKTIEEKLHPILLPPFDNTELFEEKVLMVLGKLIAFHVKEEQDLNDQNGVWVDDANSMTSYSVIRLNKSVQLWNGNALTSVLGRLVPASRFAIEIKGKTER